MEIILQCADELEDLASALAFVCGSVSRLCLEFGLLAALLLQASKWWTQLLAYAPAFAAVAGASVAVWLLGLFATLLLDRGRTSARACA